MKKCNFAYIPENMSTKIINYFKINLNLSNEDIEKLSIGVTIILFNIFEAALVFISAFLLGIIKETILFSIIFIPLRMLAAGVHCKTGSACIITTLSFYIGSTLLSKYYPVINSYAFIIGIICTIALFKYAPADTQNRPILGQEQRKKLKIKTMLIASLILLINLLISNNILFNCSMYALLLETLSVLPLTYKAFGVKYNNYKSYE